MNDYFEISDVFVDVITSVNVTSLVAAFFPHRFQFFFYSVNLRRC